MNALEIRNLTKSYPGFTLDHLNLTLPCGCILGLIGENGAGKSTLMNIINVSGNALCILVLHMGVAGVAIPTLVSRMVAGEVSFRKIPALH